MVSEHIRDYLQQHEVQASWHHHPRAVTASRLAQALHVSGRRVAKPVILRAGERFWMALIPSNEEVDVDRVAAVLGVENVRVAEESEFRNLFPDCELGSEPPFGGLYQLPVLMDERLADAPVLVFRGGSHEDAVEMRCEDFEELEHPRIGDIVWRPPEERH
ncbi:MAG: YbaK/EbsC family protein [Myxococcaceae bacterium]|nr:YbaK/EbsC family protein [Myxococcaceae bacterium]MCI0673319.1 YbaK/EbsC family protein [Myxococcaceae bacterium]